MFGVVLIAVAKWEDPGNVNGGKFVLRLKKGLADRIFESVSGVMSAFSPIVLRDF